MSITNLLDSSEPTVSLHSDATTTVLSFSSSLRYLSVHRISYDVSDAYDCCSGYDVWFGNVRGNIFSRNHTTLDLTDAAFWVFSWDDMAAK